MSLLLLLACVPTGPLEEGCPEPLDTDADTDTQEDTDVDTDTDTDVDTDTDTDVDTDTGAPPASDVDVLIVGAGPAGLSAAIEVARAGATVRVLERNDEVGGSALWSGGLMLFSGTPEQSAAGITDSAATLLSEWDGFTGGDASDTWVLAFAQRNVPDVRDWLADMGVTWLSVMSDSSAGPTPRVHPVTGGGRALVGALEDQLATDVVTLNAEAVELVTFGGRVVGARWRDLGTGAETTTYADAVIVATGGFARDLERVRAERPDLAAIDLRVASWPGADGNGLTLLEGLGAATQNLDAVGLYAHGIQDGTTQEEYLTRAITGTPWFNGSGARFVDETRSNDFRTGTSVAEQPDGKAWAFFDATAFSTARFTRNDPTQPSRNGEALYDEGLLLRADTIEDLADLVGVPTETVLADAEAYDAYLRGESSTDAFRTSRDQARALLDAPFYAAPVAVSVAKMFGGIDVDLDGRVLDTDGAVLPGAYAAGELTGMAGGSLVGDHGFTGSLSAVILGGRKAGVAAAAEALSR
jgi:predicted oxidoreductase